MLPPSVETPRGRYLQNILNNTQQSEWADWPMLTREDYVLVGNVVVLYSYIDLNLRRIAEVTDHAGIMQPPWSGKIEKLNIVDTETALLTLDWSDENRGALKKISMFRGLRNMLAHFVLRRFPTEDAFVCLASSARDFERQLGVKPERGILLTAVLDVPHIKAAIKHIEDVQLWLAKAAGDATMKFGKRA
jgi:hypothetical protein